MAKVDKSLSKGLRDFFFVQSDESDETYDYVGYMDNDGVILIARFPKDGSAGLYWVGTGTFSTVWAARATYDYDLPNTLVDPTV